MEFKKIKNYIFLTEGVSNFGGAQLLVLRRAKYLKNIGLSVKIIVHRHRGDFFLKDKFKDIPLLFLPEVELPFSLISKKRLIELNKTIELFIEDTSNCILETHSLQTAVWGEYFSSVLKIKHIIYLLNEMPIKKYKFYPYKNLFYYKYQRGELYGCSNKSLELIFDKCFHGFNQNFINVSFDPDELIGQTEPHLEIQTKKGITISTISRLEKGYIKPLILSCIKFAKKHRDQHISLIISGGTINNEIEKRLKSEFLPPNTNIPNLDIYFTGYILSLGRDFFEITDIFVGMGTASINAISQGCATINIDPLTNRTSGVFGIDTNNFAYSEKNLYYDIEDKIHFLLNNPIILNKAKLQGKILFNESFTTTSSFKKLEYLLSHTKQEYSYYLFKTNIFIRVSDYLLLMYKVIRKNISSKNKYGFR